MTWSHHHLHLDRIGVIGSGQIGPDIALHFTKAAHARGVPVVVVDISDEALQAGAARLRKKIGKGVDSGAFTPDEAAAMIANVTFTTDYDALRDASLIVEAATEDVRVKQAIFARVRELSPGAILASNSSHLEPDEIFATLPDRQRTLVIHYFFPAERNQLVEIVPGTDTDAALTDDLLSFYESIGKVPIRVGSRYGYAIDPVFEGLFLGAARLVENGHGSVKEVDAVAARALGLTVGPFTAMNLTGGNPITHHGLQEMQARFGGWWQSPALMQAAIASSQPWEVAKRGETVDVPPDRAERIRDRMRGVYFALVGDVLDSGITNVADMEMALEIGLDIRPAFSLMNEPGTARSLDLVRAAADELPGLPVPRSLEERAQTGSPWRIDYVLRSDIDDVAVLTIRRPRVRNALNQAVYDQLQQRFEEVRDDASIRAAVLTGFGPRAFVSGADVSFLAGINAPEQGFTTSQASKAVGNFIESLAKPVVCALNGPAIGGGNELAMCCTARICLRGMAVVAQQPEAALGIIPGAGATQRLPRLIGVQRAADMLRTGRPMSGAEAVETGLVSAKVDGDLIAAAVQMARDLADRRLRVPALNRGGLETPDELPAIDLGHLSRAIDTILCRAIIEGCRLPLDQGLEFESRMFAECCRSRDMRIGLDTFLEKGPRARAEFVHA